MSQRQKVGLKEKARFKKKLVELRQRKRAKGEKKQTASQSKREK